MTMPTSALADLFNAANHRRQKAERSGAFWRPSEFALLGYIFLTFGSAADPK